MKKKVLLTGSCGFIGSNFIRKVLREEKDYTFVGVDKIVSSYNLYNVYDIGRDHVFYMNDIADHDAMENVFKLEMPDIVINMAAESFVDDSIREAKPFILSNVLGTQVMVDMCLKYDIQKYIHVSTDEVMGQLKPGEKAWTEESPLNPRNPYSASKAAAELVVKAAHETHGLQYNITRCCNNYGPRQPPRNLMPKVVTCILENKKIPIHGEGKQFREWIYVDDHCDGIMAVLKNGEINNTYNIGTGYESNNLSTVNKICDIMGRGKELISFVGDRPGHDFRYSVNIEKIQKLGWKPKYTFEEGLNNTIHWYTNNRWYYQSIIE